MSSSDRGKSDPSSTGDSSAPQTSSTESAPTSRKNQPAGIAYGLGGASRYRGLDRSHAGDGRIRELVNDSIVELEKRVAKQHEG